MSAKPNSTSRFFTEFLNRWIRLKVFLKKRVKYFEFWPLLTPCLILFSLLLRNPFSERTLIPNFEPFPDSFHYITPIRCWLNGEGWQLCREGRGFSPSVPPIYSLVLVPFLLILNDARMFYFANVSMSFVSVILIFFILKKQKTSSYITFLALLIYVSTFAISWLPSLAMAENLLLLLFLAFIYMSTHKFGTKKILILSVLAPLFYFTKYAAIPLTIVGVSYVVLEILYSKNKYQQKFFLLTVLFGTSVIIAIAISAQQLILAILDYFQQTIARTLTSTSDSTGQNIPNWFRLDYFPKHFWQYLKMLWGSSTVFLWENKPLLAPWVMKLSVLFIPFLLWKKNKTDLLVLVMLLSQIIFMSTFYSFDARYIIISIPSVILIFSRGVNEMLLRIKWPDLQYGIILLLVVTVMLQHVQFYRKQIVLNLRYAETPWWYLSIKEMNIYFEEAKLNQKPILISALPPFLVDFYSNGTYQLMPLIYNHDFSNQKKELYGEYDFSNLIELYKNQFKSGKLLYVTNYGLGNESDRHADYENFLKHFQVKQIQNGCYNLCNIYEVVGIHEDLQL